MRVVADGLFQWAALGHYDYFQDAKSGLTHHSTGPARKAAQAGEFKR